MKRSLSRLCWFGLVSLVSLAATGQAQAQFLQRPPIKINTDIRFDVEFRVGPDFRRPTAPWYAYFPADPRMLPSPQMSPYPPWPSAFPPPNNSKAAPQQKEANLQRTAYQSPLWYSQSIQDGQQPIGFVPVQAPSYWYRNP